MKFARLDTVLWGAAASVVLSAMLALPMPAMADMVVSAPDGRKIVLKDDGTWRYQDAAGTTKADPKGDSKPEQGPQADLRLLRKVERGANCRLVFSLTNNLPYAIGNIVPYFAVYRAKDIMHDTQSAAFHTIRPSDSVERQVDFGRITCAEITRIQVTGGDRCEIGELNKYSVQDGQCLARVRVVPSELAPFSK